MKHKSPGNRKPDHDEIEACRPWLREQIKLINPEIIVLMGKAAWESRIPIDAKVFKTYHPAAAMRFPRYKKRFEQDFQSIR